jgi:hypothetical protein
MGGFGSGRTGGRPTVEGCSTLVLGIDDVTRPFRKAMRAQGFQSVPDGQYVEAPWLQWRWTRYGETRPWAVVQIRLELRARDGTAWLRYDVDHDSRPTGPQHYPVTLVTTPCRFGGFRWWWLCPATGRRVSKLYLPNGGTQFLSRGPGAYRLAYAVQHAGPMDRAHKRLARLHRKLGADYKGSDWPSPPKPKGMRWTTYSRLVTEIEEGQSHLDAVFVAGSQRLLARIDRSERRRAK